MPSVGRVLLVAAVIGCLPGQMGTAFQSPTAGIKVCSLLPKAQVKKLIGANEVFDMMEPEEEAVAGGSSCNYPSVMVQVIPFMQSTFDAARKRGRLEAVTGVGDEAYLYDNPASYAELYVKIGPRLLTLQRSVGMGQTVASVRPGVIALANALVAKLR
jgi:hypothetical protein